MDIEIFSTLDMEWPLSAPCLCISGLYHFCVLQVTAAYTSVSQDFYQKVTLSTAGASQKCDTINNHPQQNSTVPDRRKCKTSQLFPPASEMFLNYVLYLFFLGFSHKMNLYSLTVMTDWAIHPVLACLSFAVSLVSLYYSNK